jgi:hypothetical protein
MAERGPKPGEAEVNKSRQERRAEHAQANRRPEVAQKMVDRAAEQQAKHERDAAQAVVDAQQIEKLKQDMVEAAFFEDEPPKNLSEGGKQEGFKRAERTITESSGSSTESRRVSPPGVDRRQGYQEGGSDVQPLPAEAKPSFWNKFKDLFKSSGQKQRESLSTQPMETTPVRPRTEAEEALSKTKGHRAESTSYSGSYDTAGTKSGIAGMDMTTSTGDKMRETQKLEDAKIAEANRLAQEEFFAQAEEPVGDMYGEGTKGSIHETRRAVTRTTTSGTENSTSSTPFGSRDDIKKLGDSLKKEGGVVVDPYANAEKKSAWASFKDLFKISTQKEQKAILSESYKIVPDAALAKAEEAEERKIDKAA